MPVGKIADCLYVQLSLIEIKTVAGNPVGVGEADDSPDSLYAYLKDAPSRRIGLVLKRILVLELVVSDFHHYLVHRREVGIASQALLYAFDILIAEKKAGMLRLLKNGGIQDHVLPLLSVFSRSGTEAGGENQQDGYCE